MFITTIYLTIFSSYLQDDSTPLHIAARDGNEAIVESLLDHGASIDLKNKVCNL